MRLPENKDKDLPVIECFNAEEIVNIKERVRCDEDLETLSDAEVLEYFLSFLIYNKNLKTIAVSLLTRFGSLYHVFTADYISLCDVPEMTPNAAHLIHNFFSLVRRIYCAKGEKELKINTLDDMVDLLSPYFAFRDTEYIYMVSLDNSGRLLNVDLLTKGEAATVFFDIASLLRAALRTGAAKIIMAHNHPAGDWHPSEQDVEATKTIYNALNLLNITLSDHIIFTTDGYFSFLMAGLLPQTDINIKLENGLCLYSEERRSPYSVKKS